MVDKRADADVDRAVAGREHPAVAGHRRAVPVAEGQAGLEVTVVVAGRLDVGADGQAERLVGIALGAEHPGRLALGAGGDTVSPAWMLRRGPSPAPASTPSTRSPSRIGNASVS